MPSSDDSSNKSDPPPTTDNTTQIHHILLSGAIAAFTVDLLIYPLDTLKTRIQSRDYARVYAHNRPLLLRGLYQGVVPVIVATLPSSGAFFVTYEACKRQFSRLGSGIVPQPLIHAASSAVAECLSCAILTPAEVVKQNAQTVRREVARPQHGIASRAAAAVAAADRGGMASIAKQAVTAGPRVSAETLKHEVIEGPTTIALKRLWSTGGPRSLFRGYLALAGRNLPFTALQFPIYEALRVRWGIVGDQPTSDTSKRKTISHTGVLNAGAAAVAGTFAALLTTPIDVIKTRVMLDGTNSGGGRGYREVVEEMLREEGWRGLWRGGLLRAAWSGLGLGIYLGSYEAGKTWLGQDNVGDGDKI